MTTQTNIITNEPAAAAVMAQVLDATSKLKGAKARLTLAIRDLLLSDTCVSVKVGDAASFSAPVAAFMWPKWKENDKGEMVKDHATTKAHWEAIASECFCLDVAKMTKEDANAARSAFTACLRPAAYLAERGLTTVKVNKDGAFTGVPIAEAVNLYTDTGERTPMAKAQVEREIESASIEGKELTDEQAMARVMKKSVATVGKAGVPTSTEVLKRWAQGAVELELCPAPESRDRERAEDGKADEAIAFLLTAFEVMATTDESPFAMTDTRQNKLLKLADMISASV
jgi:hypothetical protein